MEYYNNVDLTKLNHKELLEHFEWERQEWLAAGMSEAAIYLIHFGEENEKGKGGDYRIWLDERKHTRTDHKYAPGMPVAINEVDPNSAWISGERNGIDDVETQIDLDAALSSLTQLQRFCFVEVEINGKTQVSVAVEIGKARETVKYAISAAKKNLRKYFSCPPTKIPPPTDIG